jgi:hypothetical protein
LGITADEFERRINGFEELEAETLAPSFVLHGCFGEFARGLGFRPNRIVS